MSDDEYCEFHDNGDGDSLVDDDTYCDEDNLDYNDYDDSLDAPLMRMSMICK